MAASGVLVGRGYVSIRPEFEGDWSRQATARASSAGKSASAGFGKAFGGGLKGIGALAGVAIAANLSNVAAASAVLAPMLTTAATAASALKLGLSGVGEAFKAAFADGSADAQAAASATKAVESAQRGLTSAQRALADARVQAAERVRDAQRAVADAERNLAETVEDSAQRQRDAQSQVRDAERDLRDAQRDAREAQVSLTDARRDATRSLQDMNQRLGESRLDEREAILRLKQAEEELRAAQSKPGVDPDDLARLQLAYDRAALNLTEQRTETKRLADDTAKANKAGVNGSREVASARERIAQANQGVADKQRALTKAQEDARRAGVDGAREVADAQRDLADAQRDVGKAHQEGRRQIADAQRAVADAADALADAQAAAAAQTSKLDEAMAKLAPNARSFVNAVKGLAPAWTAMRLSVQNELFRGLDTAVVGLANRAIPILQSRLTETAGIWNAMGKSAIGAADDMAKSGMLDQILAGANRSFAALKDTPGQLLTAFGQLSVAAQPAMERMMGGFAGAIKSFTDGIAASFTSGGLQQAIDTAFGILSQFGSLLGNVLGVVSEIFKAASDAGGSIVGALSAAFGELRRILALPEVQTQLRTIFESVSQVVAALVPVLGAVVQAVIPLIAAIAPAVAQIATVVAPLLAQVATQLSAALMPIVTALGPVIVQLVTSLTGALMPVISALLPVVTQVGLALLQVVQAITPLLAPIALLITSVITALAPALTPIITLVTSLVGVLVGPLTSVITSLTPALQLIATVIAQAFTALTPLLGPVVALVGQVATLLADAFAGAVLAVLNAIQPLIPVGLLLVESVVGALVPILPILGQAFTAVAQALSALMEPLTGVFASLAQQLAPVIASLAPVISQLAGILAGALAAALPPLTEALMILVQALTPVFPLIGQILGMVVQLGADLMAQLLPPLMQLVQAAVDLVVALLPILPPLAQLVGLVVQLAVQVLSWLLPPLVSLVSLLVGALAGALGTAIGWLAGLVGIVASVVGWVVDKLGPAIEWLWNTVISPVFGFIGTAAKVLAAVFAVILFGPLVILFKALGAIAMWVWEHVLSPVFGWIADKAVWLWEEKIKPAWDLLKIGIGLVADKIKQLWDTYVKPIFTWIGDKAQWLWAEKIKPAWDLFKIGLGLLGDKIKQLWDDYAKPIFDWIGDKAQSMWEKGLKPAFDKIKSAVSLVGDAFGLAKDAIGRAWGKIQDIAKKPTNFIIKWVYTKGIKAVWDRVADFVGLGKLPAAPKLLAAGGTVGSGFGPARPMVTNRPTAIVGEGNPRYPEFVIPTDPKYRNRAQALHAAAGTRLMAKGGILGGAWDWTKDTVSDVVGKGIDWAKKGADLLTNPSKVWNSLMKPVLSKVAGGVGKSKMGDAIGKFPAKMIGGLKDKIVAAAAAMFGGDGAGGGQWLKPVNGPYGTRFGVAGSMWSSGHHTGLDIPAAVGAAIRAVADGTVTQVASGGPYGKHVQLNHGGGLSSFYAHMSSIAARMGGRVSAGQTIGQVGATGNVTGPHLHLEARRNGRAVDPMPFLTGGGFTGKASGAAQRTAQGMLGRYGWGANQFGPLKQLWQHESGWRWNATNPSSGAYGIPQSLPASKMASAGADWRTNPATQIKWGMGYIKGRYGSPAAAWDFWNRQSPHWYDSGGYLQPGLNLAYNGTGRPEPVFTSQQANALTGMAAAPAGGGFAPGQPVTLMVKDGPTLHAYVADVADGRVDAGLTQVRRQLERR